MPAAPPDPTTAAPAPVGFLGAGAMGRPMAANLLRAGHPVLAWNRTPAHCQPLLDQGAELAPSVAAVFERCPVVLMSLLDEAAIDAVLAPGSEPFTRAMNGRVLVNLGTTSAAYSQALAADVDRAGGHYVEAPVSGSRVPAERGTLVGMVAGSTAAVAAAWPLLEPLCARIFPCGAVPAAMRTKLAVNHYLIAMVAALGESFHAARAAGVDLTLLRDALDAGPMSSEVSRIKLDKLLHEDFSPQARLADAGQIARLSLAQARAGGASAPLLARCVALYDAAARKGWQDLDMLAATRTLDPKA